MQFNRCYGCMAELTEPGQVCPGCGYDNTHDPEKQPSHVLPCGTILNGRYIVGKSLGQGGFGITYIGYNLALEMPVCIKEYFPEGAAMRSGVQSRLVYWGTSESAQNQKDGRESFVKEARKAVKLRELNSVVRVWDVFYENETAYLVMDYIKGETLKNWLVRGNRLLGEEECFRLLDPVMRELEQAHAAGIIHRDIKPDNLMRRPDGRLVLLDFGAAKDLSGGSGQSSFIVASQGFSPVEQYSKKAEIGPWTDVYALCATMVYCCTGKVLPTPLERLTGEEIDLSLFSAPVQEVLQRGLTIQPAKRIRSMSKLFTGLREALGIREEEQNTEEAHYANAMDLLRNGDEQSLLASEQLFSALGDYGYSKTLTAVSKRYRAALLRAEKAEAALAKQREAPTPAHAGQPTSGPGKSGQAVPGDRVRIVEDYEYKNTPEGAVITRYNGDAEHLFVPGRLGGAPVTVIDRYAFYRRTKLKTVELPDGLLRIESSAFARCSFLQRISIPASVLSIRESAFYGCSLLSEVYFSGTKVQWQHALEKTGNGTLIRATVQHFAD